ncbi:MAG: L-threonylcarbamoyladenylate synthase, partial [Pseudomonadota bacterium]
SPAEAARLRAAGDLCALPTETVYGLAALASDGTAVAKIYETKGRPRFNPLIVHCVSAEQAHGIVDFNDQAGVLAERFWPGPLTLVLPKRAEAPVSDLASAGLDTLAVRVPAHPAMREVIAALGAPIVAPSANRSGRLSPTEAAHVVDEFAGAVPVLDGGPSSAGVESSIVGLAGERPVLLRPGALDQQEIEEALGTKLRDPKGGSIKAPGMMTSHYAPDQALRLNAAAAHSGEALLGFGGTPGAVLDLSPSADLRQAASNLFAMLRTLDRQGRPIAVAPIPDEGLGRAINDRLARAAAPRN